MMPAFANASPKNDSRAAAVATELAALDLDVLCLQKAFDGCARDVIEERLGPLYPYRYGPANPTHLGLRTNSGLWVLSRIPLGGQREIEFRLKLGVERWSRKGAMLLSGRLAGDVPFQLIVTHLQGDDGPAFLPDHQEVRDEQMRQIADELIRPHTDPRLPLFICGDFATARRSETPPYPESPHYQRLLRLFGVQNGPGERVTFDDTRAHNQLAFDDTGRQTEQDYILYRGGDRTVRGTWQRLILRHTGWDGPGGRSDLSYEYAVAATLSIT
jgi:hypothetical protein